MKTEKTIETDQMKEILKQFSAQDQIRLLAMNKYIEHSLFQTSLKERPPAIGTMGVIELDLILHYKEYLKTNKGSIDNFIEHLRKITKKYYANIDKDEVIKELKMKLNSLEEIYTIIYKQKGIPNNLSPTEVLLK